jgi:heavy metal sensor kinase
MRRRSIRFRLTVWYAAALTAGFALFGAVLWLALRHQLLGDLDRGLEQRANAFERYFREEDAEGLDDASLRDELQEFSQALPPQSYIDLRDAAGFHVRYPAAAASQSVPPRILRREFTSEGVRYTLEVGASPANVTRTLRLLAWILLGLAPLVIGLAAIGGAWLSGRALKPVRDVTNAALTVSVENLSGRLPVPETGDELARLAEVLNSMLARLESAVKALSQFAADASHELRTPLSIIRTTAELALRRERPPESYREALQGVAAESARMTQLIEDLLFLARTDANAAEMPRKAIDIREVLERVARDMKPLAELREILLKMALPGEPAVVSGNGPALHRLFLVLVDNAVKYSEPGGEVRLSLAALDGSVRVSVQDFGRGISAADLPHIFRRFYRADPARSGEGHGLGLSLAESIARAHAAEINARSQPGSGTVFEIVFPARETSGPGVAELKQA